MRPVPNAGARSAAARGKLALPMEPLLKALLSSEAALAMRVGPGGVSRGDPPPEPGAAPTDEGRVAAQPE